MHDDSENGPTSSSSTQEGEKAYFKQWYEENGSKLNKDRKKRYNRDPDYRKRVLEQNRDARKRKRVDQQLAKQAEKEQEDGARKTRVEHSWKTHEMTVTLPGGKTATVQGFTIGAVAQILGCSVQAIRLWERKGVLPPTEHRYAGRDRLYPLDLIFIYRKILHEQGRLNPNKLRPRPLRMTVREVKFSDGKVREVELFRIGVLAVAAERTVVTLEQLEQRGSLPETPFRASKLGYRLYTEDMIESVASALKKRFWEIRGEEEWTKFHDEVHQAWAEQGVIGAEILPLATPVEEKPKAKKPRKPAKK